MNDPHQSIDFLIVGQGLAGSLMAWFLLEQGMRVHIVDSYHQGSSSMVAAGIINPITGRRLVKSWMIDELLPVAKSTYQDIEQKLGISIYKERNIYRALKDITAENQWDERSAQPGYTQYLSEAQPTNRVKETMAKTFSWGTVHHAAQVNVPALLTSLKTYFTDQQILRLADFKYDQMTLLENGHVSYNNILAKQVIFCEGHQARFNPWFKHLPFVVSKGEMLEIEIEQANDFPIIKHNAYLAPLGGQKFWVGATYEWKELDNHPTEKGKKALIKSLDKSLASHYNILKQNAAIRPTVKDRRPFLGTHSTHYNLHIFNGLGTKGTSLGPYWASHFTDYLMGRKDLHKEVDIRRFTT